MRLLNFVVLLLFSYSLQSQCFNPPDGYTLYSTTNAVAYGTAYTGFETLSESLSGKWSVNPATTGVTANFSDDEGRTSTLSLSGTGTLVIDNVVDDVNTFPTEMNACTQNFSVLNYTPIIGANPGLPATCPLNIVLVIDESGSISENMSTQLVRDAVLAMASNLQGTGSKMAIVEFASTAQRISIGGTTDLQEINANFTTGLNTYLTNDYDPQENPTLLIGGTNWEDALVKAGEVPGQNLIIVLTDGRPTFYNIGSGMGGLMGIAGEGDVFDLTALKEAQDQANTLKLAGSRIFVSGINFPSNVQSMIDISGPNQLPNSPTITDFMASDYSLVDPNDLVSLFSSIGSLCAPPKEPIPTLGEWGVISLSFLLLIFGLTAIKQPIKQPSKQVVF